MTINQVNNLESALSVRQKINLTIDKANSIPDNMTATWNNSGEVFTGIKLGITDTASDASSLLMDLQVGGASQFKINKDAGIRFGIGSVAGAAGVGLFSLDNTAIAFGQDAGSAGWGGISSNGFLARQSAYYGWGNSTLAAPDLFLYRDAANTLAQRNGTNPQTFNLYNTYTNSTNYERASFTQTATGLVLDAQFDGTGLEPDNILELKSGGTSKFSMRKDGLLSVAGQINCSGGDLIINRTGSSVARIGPAAASFSNAIAISSTYNVSTPDVYMHRDAANTLAQRNGTFAQTFNLYNTYTDASNYERASFTQTATGLVLDAQFGGTGLEPDNILELKSGGTSKFKVDKTGVVRMAPGSKYVSAFSPISGSTFTFNSTQFDFYFATSFETVSIAPGTLKVGYNSKIEFADSSNFSGVRSSLVAEAANTLAQRNSTNPQTFNLYNTYTDASNYERGFMKWLSGNLEIGTEKDGTGSTRNVFVRVGGVRSAIFSNTYVQFDVDFYPTQNIIMAAKYTEMAEMTAPSAPAANKVRIYAEDDGAGKTRLMALFGTGSAKAFAGEDFQTVKSDTTQAGANTASINNIVTVTQAEYDLLTPDADTVYFITA